MDKQTRPVMTYTRTGMPLVVTGVCEAHSSA